MEKKCINCGNEFKTSDKNKKYCNRDCYFEYANKNKLIGKRKVDVYENRKCIVCDNEFKVRKKTQKKMCSDECRLIWGNIEENKNKRIENAKNAVFEKYGLTSTAKLESVKETTKKNNIEKYGVDNPMKKKEFVDKLKESIRSKTKTNLLNKLSNYNIELLDEYVNKDNNNTSYKFKCLKCYYVFSSTVTSYGKIPLCRKCYPINKNSKSEKEICGFLTENNISFITSNRKLIKPFELDIYVPENKIAIEVNGNYWHSELFGGKDKEYHLNKTEACEAKGLHLIHIFEDEWLFKKDIVKSRLLNLFGVTHNKIYARKTDIREVSSIEAKDFLNYNHIQGNVNSSHRIGLYYNDELVSLMTFGKLRVALGNKSNNNTKYELLRFCNKLDTNVIGGASKLFKYFIKNYKFESIISYADRRWSQGDLYNKLGFSLVKTTTPNYWYIHKDSNYYDRLNRFNFRKDILVKDGFDPNKTEKEIMLERGFSRIWDVGSYKFEFGVTDQGVSFDDV